MVQFVAFRFLRFFIRGVSSSFRAAQKSPSFRLFRTCSSLSVSVSPPFSFLRYRIGTFSILRKSIENVVPFAENDLDRLQIFLVDDPITPPPFHSAN